MSIHDQAALLRQIALFANVDESHLKVLAFATEHVVLLNGQTLIKKGDDAKAAYLIISGEAEAYSNDDDDETTKTTIVTPNSFVGEMAMLGGQPYAATIKATSRLEALKISKELFFRVIGEFPDMAVEVRRVINNRLTGTLSDLSRIKYMLNKPDL